MPFANTGGAVVVSLQERRDGHSRSWNQRLVCTKQHASLQVCSPTVTARQNAVPRRRANGRTGVSIRKRDAGRCQRINLRRRDFSPLRIQALNVTVAQVIGQNVNDVRFAVRLINGRSFWLCSEIRSNKADQ